MVNIRKERCKGCGLCVRACPMHILELAGEINANGYHPAVVTDMEKCVMCTSCALTCPDMCIEITEEQTAG